MTKEDMRSFANLLSLTAQLYDKLAINSVTQEDNDSYTIFQARGQLSSILANKLVEACRMPEPVSRDFH